MDKLGFDAVSIGGSNLGRRFRVTLLLVIGALAFSSATVEAFDGVRKGFVIGGGAGIAANSHWEIENSSISDDKAGFGLNLLIGYAWDESNMLVFEGNATAFTTNRFFSSKNKSVSQGFNGAAWYHYYGIPGRSLFTAVGLGVYGFDVEGLTANDPGFGLLLGFGYEFAKHWQTGVYVSAGQTSFGAVDVKHSHINVLLDVMAF